MCGTCIQISDRRHHCNPGSPPHTHTCEEEHSGRCQAQHAMCHSHKPRSTLVPYVLGMALSNKFSLPEAPSTLLVCQPRMSAKMLRDATTVSHSLPWGRGTLCPPPPIPLKGSDIAHSLAAPRYQLHLSVLSSMTIHTVRVSPDNNLKVTSWLPFVKYKTGFYKSRS